MSNSYGRAKARGRGIVAAHAAIVLCLVATGTSVLAQNFPVKPIRLIVPYSPGGDTDFVSRLIGSKLGDAMGQQIVVENRPGAGSLIGTEAMLRSPADGYTMALGTISSLAVLPVTKAKVPYDPVKDIAPIVLATVVPYVLHVHPSVPATSVMDLVRLAKAQPGQFTYGTPGIATGVHLTTEYFSTVAGIRLVHVPYKGSAPAMVDLIGGNIYAAFTTFATTRTHLHSGRIRALGIAARTRSKDFPDVPTMSESGFPGFEASTWHGLVTRGRRAGTHRHASEHRDRPHPAIGGGRDHADEGGVRRGRRHGSGFRAVHTQRDREMEEGGEQREDPTRLNSASRASEST